MKTAQHPRMVGTLMGPIYHPRRAKCATSILCEMARFQVCTHQWSLALLYTYSLLSQKTGVFQALSQFVCDFNPYTVQLPIGPVIAVCSRHLRGLENKNELYKRLIHYLGPHRQITTPS